MGTPPSRRFVMLRGVASAAIILGWLVLVLLYVTQYWDTYERWQSALILLASLIAMSMLNTLVSPVKAGISELERTLKREWTKPRGEGAGEVDGGEAPPWTPGWRPRMPPGLEQRTTISIVAGVTFALYLLLHAALLWPSLSVSQNLALVVAVLIVLVMAMMAVWVPWGLRFADLNDLWRKDGHEEGSRGPPREPPVEAGE